MSDRAKVEITWIGKDNRPKLEPYAFRHPGRHRPPPRATHRRDRGEVAAKGIGKAAVFYSVEVGMSVKDSYKEHRDEI